MSSLSRTIARNMARAGTIEAVSKGYVKCPKCGQALKHQSKTGRGVACKCGWRGRIK